MLKEEYLKIGKASDIKNRKDRIAYRAFEMMPAFLSWGGLILVVFLSWRQPYWIAIFIICFSIYWLFRTIYFSFHLWSGYRKMTINEKTDWIKKLDELPCSEYSLPSAKNWRDIYHLIVIPSYKEPLEVLRDTFRSLEKSDYPKADAQDAAPAGMLRSAGRRPVH